MIAEEKYVECDTCGEKFNGDDIRHYLMETWIAQADGNEYCHTHCRYKKCNPTE